MTRTPSGGASTAGTGPPVATPLPAGARTNAGSPETEADATATPVPPRGTADGALAVQERRAGERVFPGRGPHSWRHADATRLYFAPRDHLRSTGPCRGFFGRVVDVARLSHGSFPLTSRGWPGAALELPPPSRATESFLGHRAGRGRWWPVAEHVDPVAPCTASPPANGVLRALPPGLETKRVLASHTPYGLGVPTRGGLHTRGGSRSAAGRARLGRRDASAHRGRTGAGSTSTRTCRVANGTYPLGNPIRT